MCGVIGLIYENHHEALGRVAAELLKTLEYRGYDSTGAAIQGPGAEVQLRKGVGAPSAMVHELGIVDLAGQILCGQVRWATFGAVTELNSQPHVVRCKRYLYGAHNGNVTNCDDLKAWLTAEGHEVLSDNDGEMVVHTIEHFFAAELAREPAAAQEEPAARRRAMRAAIVLAAARLQGSYAAVMVDPLTRTVWAIKQGSSLYFGFGGAGDASGGAQAGGRFAIASSDLSAVLRLTRALLPLAEGEFVEYTALGHEVYAVKDRRSKTPEGERLVRAGTQLPRTPVRSRLRAKDTALLPGFSTFMEQEIHAQPQTLQGLITLFLGGSEALRLLSPALSALPEADRRVLGETLDGLRDLYDDALIRRRFHGLVDLPACQRLLRAVPAALRGQLQGAVPAEGGEALVSSEAGFFTDLLSMARGDDDRLAVRLLDALLEREEVEELSRAVQRFTDLCREALAARGRIFVVCCGSSYHAAKAAALFFNELACVEIEPVLPGEFRGQHARSLRDGDLFVAVSQSGETKDLIDVLNQVIAGGRRIGRVALVNNLNSTLAQEKCELVIPLRCGPEVAVPATKSFLSQMGVFYCLALRLGERLAEELPAGPEREERRRAMAERRQRLPLLPALIRDTLALGQGGGPLEEAAELLYLCPSLHILGTRMTAVALEGALKIREVVLNHTQGYEASEFKHGPNTILGWNTLFGPRQVAALLDAVGAAAGRAVSAALEGGLPAAAAARLAQAAVAGLFAPGEPAAALPPTEGALLAATAPRLELLRALAADYPLLYVTGPDELDVNLTVSQMNTHKIRGASTLVVAEEHPALRQAATKAPVDNPGYRSVYLPLPATGDPLMTAFSSTVALQLLALHMSLRKQAYLDRLGIPEHGVHPDAPKNVSKSITVD